MPALSRGALMFVMQMINTPENKKALRGTVTVMVVAIIITIILGFIGELAPGPHPLLQRCGSESEEPGDDKKYATNTDDDIMWGERAPKVLKYVDKARFFINFMM